MRYMSLSDYNGLDYPPLHLSTDSRQLKDASGMRGDIYHTGNPGFREVLHHDLCYHTRTRLTEY